MLKGYDELRKKYVERFEIYKVHAEIKNRIIIGKKEINGIWWIISTIFFYALLYIVHRMVW